MAETLVSRLTELETVDPIRGCKVPLVSDSDPEACEILTRLLANKEISVRRIQLVLKASSVAIGTDSLYKHRNQICSCFE
jgi:hypothetical protein